MSLTDEAIAGELALLDPQVRADATAVDALLHPDFAERGKSGRWWDREDTLQSLPNEADYERVEAHDVVANEIALGVVLVTYVGVQSGRAVGRSSVWLLCDGRMRIRWHQGTTLPGPAS